jgi:transcriptional regulator with XRE-family HTH domain
MRRTPFAEALRSARYFTNTTQTDIADALGVNPSYFGGLEAGDRLIPLKYIPKIVKVFAALGHPLDERALRALAFVHNDKIPLDGLPAQQKRLVAELCTFSLTEEQIAVLRAAANTLRLG